MLIFRQAFPLKIVVPNSIIKFSIHKIHYSFEYNVVYKLAGTYLEYKLELKIAEKDEEQSRFKMDKIENIAITSFK